MDRSEMSGSAPREEGNAFGRWIAKSGLTRLAVAQALGVGDSAVSKLCKPGYWPRAPLAVQIYELTGGAVTPNDILDGAMRRDPEASAAHQAAQAAIAEARRKRREIANAKKKPKPRA